VPVVLMTAYGNLDAAVEAIHKGAFEYLHKPVDLGKLKDVIARALSSRQAPVLALSCGMVSAASDEQPVARRLVGRSIPMQEVYKLIALVSRSDVPVLIEGESGVGKELVARAIHDYGDRRNGPFVAINCAALPDALLESELFGYEKGAFTGAQVAKPGRYELAHGGTLFLDELAELSLAHQTKLLRVLQDGCVEHLGGTRTIRVDVRIIAASSRALPEAVAAKQFREDLYFRLHVVALRVPPLRERTDDLPDLVAHFMGLVAQQTRRPLEGIDRPAMDAILGHHWPGNVRELENAVRHAAAVSRDGVLRLADLPATVSGGRSGGSPPGTSALRVAAEAELRERLREVSESGGSIYHDVLSTIEDSLVQTALAITGGNQVRAADLLGVTRMTLRRRMNSGSTLDRP
jgi:two-component system nitrogen regulation response regulator GlnG